MALSKEEIKELKEQLKSQISHLPPEKKKEAENQIDEMSSETLETMLEQQRSQKDSIFRLIVSGEVEAVKVGENSEALAVLDINPISKGHIMIIPKILAKNPKEIPKSAFQLGEEISKKITSFLKAKSARLETSVQFGEAIIHLIPIYDSPLDLSSKRTKATPEELNEVKKTLETIKIEKKIEKIKKQRKPKKEKPIVLNRRIP